MIWHVQAYKAASLSSYWIWLIFFLQKIKITKFEEKTIDHKIRNILKYIFTDQLCK